MRVDGIGSATSALSTSIAAMAAAAHNVANIQTVKPTSGAAFQGEQVITAEGSNGGVFGIVAPAGTPEGHLVSDPSNPMADASGMVRMPDIDVGMQLVEMIKSQELVKTNVTSIRHAIDSYRELLAVTDRERSTLAASNL
jgi:flagellar basal-body rod protein FlgC